MRNEEVQDSRTPTRSVVITSLLFVFGLVIVVFVVPECQREALLKNGIQAEALILDARDTGDRYNDQPRVALTLEVRPKDGAPYKAVAKMYISPVYLPRFQPGAQLSVRYDPKDPQRVAVEETQKFEVKNAN